MNDLSGCRSKIRISFLVLAVLLLSASPALANVGDACTSNAQCNEANSEYCQDTGTAGDGNGTCQLKEIVTLLNQQCPTNLASCTANDVVTTVISSRVLANDNCNDGFINVEITMQFESTAQSRYDLGLLVALL